MITLLNSKIEDEIANHFQENYELNKEDYECEFTFDGAEILVPYSIIHEVVSYKNDEISATKDEVSYSIEDKKHFKIRRVEQSKYVSIESKESKLSKELKLKKPKNKTLQQEIDSIIEREGRKAESRDDRQNIMNDYKTNM